MVHLVYCDNAGKKGVRVLDKIIAGTKTMVVRGAAGRKIPHSRVFEGERLYFIEKGSASITATAIVKSVQNYVKLSEEEITRILSENSGKLNLSDKHLNIKAIWMIGLFYKGVRMLLPGQALNMTLIEVKTINA